MPAQGSKGAVAPSGKSEEKQQSRSEQPSKAPQQPEKLRGPVASVGDQVPPGVLEDSKKEERKVSDTKKAAAKGADTGLGTGVFSQPNMGNYQAGVKREASVQVDQLTGATVVLSDRLKSHLTGETLEVLQEPRTDEEADQEMRQVQRKLASGKPATD